MIPKMNTSPKFAQPIKTAVKQEKYNINNINIYIKSRQWLE